MHSYTACVKSPEISHHLWADLILAYVYACIGLYTEAIDDVISSAETIRSFLILHIVSLGIAISLVPRLSVDGKRESVISTVCTCA